MKYLAVDLANKLANALPYHGSISRLEAKRILIQIDHKLTNGQIEQILILAKCLGYVKFDNGGTTIRRVE